LPLERAQPCNRAAIAGHLLLVLPHQTRSDTLREVLHQRKI
jgi:hypothetical protein